MARTPLLRSLRKLYRDYRLAKRHNIPLEAIHELRASRGITRRQLLAGTAVGAGALTLPKIVRAAPGSPKIVIVGAGIAGLTCAVRLADRGIAATVYEASGRAGGRMFSKTKGWADNQVTEWGGELIDTGHENIQLLAARFGLELTDLLAAQPAGTTDTYYFQGHFYPTARADKDFVKHVLDRVVEDEASAPFPSLYNNFTDAAFELDNMSVYDWIESRVPGGHKSPLGLLLDTAYTVEYCADTRDQSSLNLIYLLAFQPDEEHLAIYGESDEAFHIRGGNQQLPNRMAAALGPTVNFGYRLSRLTKTAGGRYTLTFERANGVTDVTADLVVLALPFAVLRGLDIAGAGLSPFKTRIINELGRNRCAKLALQFTERQFGNGNSYSDTGYQATWEATRGQPGQNRILVFFSGPPNADAMTSTSPFATISQPGVAADVDRTLEQVAPVYPGLAPKFNGLATESLFHKSPFANLAYCYYRVGQTTAFAGYEQVTEGGVLFCGEHTSVDFQGFMEGAAEQGRQRARELAKMIRGRDDADMM